VTSPGRAHFDIITSDANPAITLVRSLARRDRRAEERAFVVEGVRAVRDALETGAVPRLILLRQERGNETAVDDLLLPADATVRYVESRLFDRLSDVQTPQGVLAVFPFPDLAPDLSGTAPLVLLLDHLRDPGNVGTLLRAAAGAGVDAVYLSPQTVDPWNPKVVRAGMGAHFRVPIASLDQSALATLRERLPLRVVARGDATLAYDAVDWTSPAVLIVGGEAEGVGDELNAWGTQAVTIPLASSVESLNAAVAGAVILFEAARQRRAHTHARPPSPIAMGEGEP
jgi:TrmH family RNA methyltransferase